VTGAWPASSIFSKRDAGPTPVGASRASPAQDRVLVPEHQQLGIFECLAPGEHHQAAQQATREQVGDREDHSAIISAH
jgi:hypothetical protein